MSSVKLAHFSIFQGIFIPHFPIAVPDPGLWVYADMKDLNKDPHTSTVSASSTEPSVQDLLLFLGWGDLSQTAVELTL